MLSEGMARLKLRVVVYLAPGPDDGPYWVARGIDKDILGEGGSYAEAEEDFKRAVRAEFAVARAEGIAPLSNIDPAPAKFQEMWRHVKELAEQVSLAPAEPGPVLSEPPRFQFGLYTQAMSH